MAQPGSLALQFIAETRDNLDDAARGLLALESSAESRELINSIFRSFHTIKGTSGIFPEFQTITSITHAAEELMDEIRNGRMALATEHVDLLLNTLDLVGNWLDEIESTGGLPHDAASVTAPLRESILLSLNRRAEKIEPDIQQSVVDKFGGNSTKNIREWLARLPVEVQNQCLELVSGGSQCFALCYTPDENCFFFGDDPVNLLRQLSGIVTMEIVPRSLPDSPEEYDPFICLLAFYAVVNAGREDVASIFAYVEDQLSLLQLLPEHFASDETAASQEQDHTVSGLDIQGAEPAPPVSSGGHDSKKTASTSVLKIEQRLVNRFVDMVGEMIIAKNALPYLGRRAAAQYNVLALAEEIDASYDAINRIAENFHDIALEMRMLPVSKAFERFPRLVRDISAKLGKKVRLVMEGEETRADKDVIDALSEPLVHMMRNSLDHGIESPEERVAAGKAPEGSVRLSAFQENAGIVVEIADDGRGIDPAKIRRKAADKGIATVDALAAMSDEDVIQLIMAPNFSTAEVVSDLSGRGVGMDVVNNMVRSFGGAVRIFSRPGSGSRVRMTLPLSMAITKVLIIKHGECTFGIPSAYVVETLMDIRKSRITNVHTAPGLEVRGALVPLYHLSRQLAMQDISGFLEDDFSAVLVKVGGNTVALAVDSFHDILDVVIKPLEGLLAGISYYSGSAILGDGTIMFILDLPEVICNAG